MGFLLCRHELYVRAPYKALKMEDYPNKNTATALFSANILHICIKYESCKKKSYAT